MFLNLLGKAHPNNIIKLDPNYNFVKMAYRTIDIFQHHFVNHILPAI